MRPYQAGAEKLARAICAKHGFRYISNFNATTSKGVFKVEAEAKLWVLKIAEPGSSISSEYKALKAWEQSGRVPKVEYLNDQQLLIEYLEGEPVSLNNRKDQLAYSLGQSVRGL